MDPDTEHKAMVHETDILKVGGGIHVAATGATINQSDMMWLPPGTKYCVNSGGNFADAPTQETSVEGDLIPAFAVTLTQSAETSIDVQPHDFLVVLDTSYSMCGLIEDVVCAVRTISKFLNPLDRLGIVGFNHEASTVYPLTPAIRCGEDSFESAVSSLKAEGGTNIISGVVEAMRVLSLGKNQTQEVQAFASNPVCLLLMSDGFDNNEHGHLHTVVQNLVFECDHDLTIHAFGFGEDHDSETLATLAGIGKFGPGSYYPISAADGNIVAAIGDCLGALRSSTCRGLSITAQIDFASPSFPVSSLPLTAFTAMVLHAGEVMGEEEYEHSDFSMSMDQRAASYPISLQQGLPHTIIFVCGSHNQIEDFETASCDLKLRLHCQNACGEDSISIPIDYSTTKLATLTVYTHILREQTAKLLQEVAALSQLQSVIFPTLQLQLLHTAVLNVLCECELVTHSIDLLQIEGILESLEQDLGSALERAENVRICTIQDYMAFRCFGEEHRHQRGIGMASSFRTAYSTQLQLRTKLAFLANRKVIEQKPSDVVPTPNSVEKQLREDRSNDDICFITLDGWDSCHLGLGLTVKPRTLRERSRLLLPQINLAEDYLSAEGYNAGVRCSTVGLGHGVNNDEDSYDEPCAMAVSSSRRRINAWLPLYVNAEHWRKVSPLAPSAFSLLATQWNSAFEPSYALDVCCRILCCTALKFGQEIKCASDKAMQMHTDVYRLLIQMAIEYPSVKKEAVSRVTSFLSDSKHRSRKSIANLGDLVQLLPITGVSWLEFEEAIIPELLRRKARWVGKLLPHEFSSLDDLTERFRSQDSNVTHVTLAFLQVVVGLNEQPNLQTIAGMLDTTWSKLKVDHMRELKAAVTKIHETKSVAAKVRLLCTPGGKAATLLQTDSAIHELVLYAIENRKEDSASYETLGSVLAGGRKHMYHLRRQLLLHSQTIPPPKIVPMIAPRQESYRGMIGVAQAVRRARYLAMRQFSLKDTIPCVTQRCSCNRCRRMTEPLSFSRPDIPNFDPAKTLFVSRIPPTVSENGLKAIVELVSGGASPKRIHLVADAKTRKHKGYGFIEFDSESDTITTINVGATHPSSSKPEGWRGNIIFDVWRKALLLSFRPMRHGGGVGVGRGSVQILAPKLSIAKSPTLCSKCGCSVKFGPFEDVVCRCSTCHDAGCQILVPPANIDTRYTHADQQDTETKTVILWLKVAPTLPAWTKTNVCVQTEIIKDDWPPWVEHVHRSWVSWLLQAQSGGEAYPELNVSKATFTVREGLYTDADSGWMQFTWNSIICALDPLWMEWRKCPRGCHTSVVLQPGDLLWYNGKSEYTDRSAYAMRRWKQDPTLTPKYLTISFHSNVQ